MNEKTMTVDTVPAGANLAGGVHADRVAGQWLQSQSRNRFEDATAGYTPPVPEQLLHYAPAETAMAMGDIAVALGGGIAINPAV